MSEKKAQSSSRRTFLVGVLTGAGVAAAASAAVAAKGPHGGRTASAPRSDTSKEPILYRRGAEAERYYKTLYQV